MSKKCFLCSREVNLRPTVAAGKGAWICLGCYNEMVATCDSCSVKFSREDADYARSGMDIVCLCPKCVDCEQDQAYLDEAWVYEQELQETRGE